MAKTFDLTFSPVNSALRLQPDFGSGELMVSTMTEADREEASPPPPFLPAAFAIKLVSIRFIFLSEKASAKYTSESELEDDEEEGEGIELNSIEWREPLHDIIDLTAASIPPPPPRPDADVWCPRHGTERM